jgi:HK97 family phage major capsid protein
MAEGEVKLTLRQKALNVLLIMKGLKKMYDEIKENIRKLSERIMEICQKAANQGRGLTREEASIVAQMEGGISALEKELPERALTVQRDGPIGNYGGSITRGSGKPYALRGPHDAKDYRSLFGSTGGAPWTDKESSFFQAVFSGRHHPGLIRNAMTETIPSDGGYLVPTQQAEKIHAVSLENELVMPRCFVQPMTTNEFKLPGLEVGDHSSNLYGGFTASYVDEAGTINEHSPKTRSMTLNAKKLTGLLRFSNELAQDIPGGENQVIQICGKGLSWYRDKAFLKGTGAGEPLGILNAGCLIEVDKETGQAADTVTYGNLTKMMAGMFAGSFANSVWVCHQTTIPQLLTLSLAIGTGGDAIPVMKESNGQFSILTRPVLFTEKTEPLGNKGDIMLVDFSQYVVGLRQGMRFDLSIHAHFQTDELLARLIERHDGQPLWGEALTLADGSARVSPFVALGAR